MTKPIVIGISGLAGSGKGIASQAMVDLGFERIKQADPLKNMLRTLFRDCGLSEEEIERRIEGDLKETPDRLLQHATPRLAMITLGTEWGRDLISPKLWSDLWFTRAFNSLRSGRSVVCDDVRFPEEVAAIRALGGFIIRIERSSRSRKMIDHPSERPDLIPHDLLLENDGSIDSLRLDTSSAVEWAIRETGRRTANESLINVGEMLEGEGSDV
jgi:hypothetical protein